MAKVFINVYEQFREYGGPEEGGWWYDAGVFQPDMSYSVDEKVMTLEEGEEVAAAYFRALWTTANKSLVPGVYSTQYRGGRYSVGADTKQGEDYPKERPVYQ